METNILILSVGTRNKIIQYFKKNMVDGQGKRIGNVIATDMSENAPAIYEADKFYVVPRMTDVKYLDVIIDICKKERISGVLSLIDPELSLLAKNKERFTAVGTTVIGSDYELCERALNKMSMYRWLITNGFNCAKSYDNITDFYIDLENGDIAFPVFVKPVCGSASLSITKVWNKENLNLLVSNSKPGEIMIQEFLDGQEIGADCYIDMISKEVVSIFTKKKLVMRAGETDKAVSFKDEKLFELIKCFINKSGWLGQIDIDIFDVKGEYYISEVNPRFGGGYPHAYECGVNHMSKIIANLQGKQNEVTVGSYDDDIYMMKYNEIMIRK